MPMRIRNPDSGEAETWLPFKPGKTSRSNGHFVAIARLAALRESMAATVHGLETFLIPIRGKPHASGDRFANGFRDRCAEDDGATETQTMVWPGRSPSRLAAYYSRKTDDRRMLRPRFAP